MAARRDTTKKSFDVTAALARSPVLAALTSEEIEALAEAGTSRAVKKGQVLFAAGDPATEVLVVLRGSVRLWRSTGDGHELALRTGGPGEILGQMSALDESAHSLNATAEEPTEVLRISAGAYRVALESNGKAALALARALAERVRALSEDLEAMKFSSIGDRVVRRLQQRGEGRREIRLTHQTLANEVGSSRENVSRVLEMLADEGILTLRRGTIEIRDHARLGSIELRTVPIRRR